MNKRFCVIIVTLFCIVSVVHPSQIEWKRIYGGNNYDKSYCLSRTKDGAFLFSGVSLSNPLYEYEPFYWICKVDSTGRTYWSKYLPASSTIPDFCSIQEINGGKNIALFANLRHDPVERRSDEIILFYLNAQGDTLWTKKYGSRVESKMITDGYMLQDGSFILSGSRNTNNSFGGYLLKIDSSFNEEWIKNYGESETVLRLTRPSKNGGYYSAGTNNQRFWLLRLSENGDTLWTKTYNVGAFGVLTDMEILADKSCILVGNMEQENYKKSGTFDRYLCLVKVDSIGIIEWVKSYTKDIYPCDILATADNGFVVVGSSSYGGLGLCDGIVLRLKSNGDTLWTKEIHQEMKAIVHQILPVGDNSYICVGNIYSFERDYDTWLFKLKIEDVGVIRWEYSLPGNNHPSSCITDRAMIYNLQGKLIDKSYSESNKKNSLSGGIYLERKKDNGVHQVKARSFILAK
jgi:hypothetical protein